MQSYLGRMISTALPRISNSRASPYTTSARPPTLGTGVSPHAINTTNMAGMAGRGGGAASRAGVGSSASGSDFFSLGISLTTACSETGGAGGVTGFCGGSSVTEGAATFAGCWEKDGSGFLDGGVALVGSVLESGRTVAGGTRAGAPVGISILAGIGLTSTDTGVGRGVGDAATAFMGSGVGGIGATALFAAAGTTDGLVSGTPFVSGTGLISATGLAPTVGRVSIPCLITADCNASASGLMPAAGLISVRGFGTAGP